MPTAFHLAKQCIGPLPAAGGYPFKIHRLVGLWSQQSFLPHFTLFFAHGFSPLSLLVSLVIVSFLLLSFVCVCLLPSCAPESLLYSFFLSFSFFPLFSFPFLIYYVFFFLVPSPPLHFLLKFCCLIPSISPSFANQSNPIHTKYIKHILSYIVNTCTIYMSSGQSAVIYRGLKPTTLNILHFGGLIFLATSICSSGKSELPNCRVQSLLTSHYSLGLCTSFLKFFL